MSDYTRNQQILRELAEGFENGCCKLYDSTWLAGHKITLDEITTIGDVIGTAIRAWVNADSELRLLQSVAAMGESRKDAESMLNQARMLRSTQKAGAA